MQASYYSVNSSSFKSSEKNNENGSRQPLSSNIENEWNHKQQPQSSQQTGNIDHYNQLQQQHVLYGVTGKIGLTCRQQKIQMDSGDVYVVQDLYGMSTAAQSTEHSSTAVATTTTSMYSIYIYPQYRLGSSAY
jgi:hypothetical protein